jgi:type IV secretory pathway TrbL component
MAGAVPVPSVDTASSPLATLAGYSTILIVVVVGIAVMMAVVAWAFGEE